MVVYHKGAQEFEGRKTTVQTKEDVYFEALNTITMKPNKRQLYEILWAVCNPLSRTN